MLTGIRVIDLTNLLPGPFCTLLLAEMGAEVIKIESLTGDPLRYVKPQINGLSELFLRLNQGKRLMALNLKSEEGQKILHNLLSTADVLVEGFRPSTAKRLGLDPERLQKMHPRLIHISINGFGRESPYEERPAHDLNYLGYTGLLNNITTPLLPIQLADIGGGSLLAVIGILAALHERERSPQRSGRFLDLSILDGITSWLATINGLTQLLSNDSTDDSIRLDGSEPWYRIYRTRDNKRITLACVEDKFWEIFCKRIEREDLIPRKNDASLHRELEEIFLQKEREEWIRELAETTCVGPVYSFGELASDLHFTTKHRFVNNEGFVTLEPLGIISKQSLSPKKSTLPLGKDTLSILQELDYSIEEIKELQKQDVLKSAS